MILSTFLTVGHTGIVKFLIKNGANVDALTKDGETALLRAADEGKYLKSYFQSHTKVITQTSKFHCDI